MPKMDDKPTTASSFFEKRAISFFKKFVETAVVAPGFVGQKGGLTRPFSVANQAAWSLMQNVVPSP